MGGDDHWAGHTDGPSTGQALIEHGRVGMVSLTGSTATGKQVMQAASKLGSLFPSSSISILLAGPRLKRGYPNQPEASSSSGGSQSVWEKQGENGSSACSTFRN